MMQISKGEEEEERGGGYYNIDYIVFIDEKKSSSHVKAGLAYIRYFLVNSTSNFGNFLYLLLQKNKSERGKSLLMKNLAEEIKEKNLNLQFDEKLVDLVNMECELHGK